MQNSRKKNSPDFLLSHKYCRRYLKEERKEYKAKYLVDLSEHEHNVLNLMLENTDKPEEKIYGVCYCHKILK